MRPLRDTAPEKVHLITCRTAQAEMLLVPKPALNEIVGGVFAHYADKYRILLYGLSVQSTHYHNLCRAPLQNLPLFQENVNREIAHRVNRYLGRRGVLWGRRYDDQVVLGEDDAVEALLYIITNPVHHGLVQHPKHWPGINSYHQNLGATPRQYQFVHYSEYHAALRRAAGSDRIVKREDFETSAALKFEPLPSMEHLSEDERRARLCELIERRTAKLISKRRAEGKGFLNRKTILAQPEQGSFPEVVSRSPRPACYSKIAERIKEYKKEYRGRRAWYTVASTEFRSGNFTIEFPPFSIRPPYHHTPKRSSNGARAPT